MKQLIEDYKLILKNVNEMLETSKNSGSENDIKKFTRLNTKASTYKTFIAELEREEKNKCTNGFNVSDAQNLIDKYNNAQKLIDIMFEVAFTIKESAVFNGMSNESLASWIRFQLNSCGFETEPMGMSWGVLKK
jgi:hypothetical protein